MEDIKKIINKNIHIIYICLVLLLGINFWFYITVIINKNIINIDNISKFINNLYYGLGIFIILIVILSLIYYKIIRTNILRFSDRIGQTIDNIIDKNESIEFEIYEETITSKIENKLKQLFEIMENERVGYLREKDSIKILISDISHQIKTPITNISIYNDTLINRELSIAQRKLCLNNMKFQVDKLEWLVKCLIKMSRLESGIINLNKNKVKISEIVANALGGVYLKAEEKEIDINIECDDKLYLSCDNKWTSEAIFNILENAVKYTNTGGKIYLIVEKLDLFTRIDIIDNGIGIYEHEINNIFNRFYRASEVSHEEGVGIGLYLSREIISKQGGYIKVKSKKDIGSKFSIYLLN